MTIRRFLCDNPDHGVFEATTPRITHKLHCPQCKTDWVYAATDEYRRRLGDDWSTERLLELAETSWHNAVDNAIQFDEPLATPVEEVDAELDCWSE